VIDIRTVFLTSLFIDLAPMQHSVRDDVVGQIESEFGGSKAECPLGLERVSHDSHQ
jgi:hypothetical protein